MEINIINVFVNKDGQFSNPVGIIVDEEDKINENEQASFPE